MAAPLPTADSHAALPTFADAKCWHCRSCRSRPAVSYAKPLANILKFVRFIKIIILFLTFCSCSKDKYVTDFETTLGSENSEILTDLVADFETNFLKKQYPKLKTENAYEKFLTELREEKSKGWYQDSDNAKQKFKLSSLKNEVYRYPDSVWVVKNSSLDKNEDSFVILFSSTPYIKSRYKYINPDGSFEYSYSRSYLNVLPNTDFDSIIALKMTTPKFNSTGKYIQALSQIKEKDTFFKNFYRQKDYGYINPVTLANLVLKEKVDLNDYLVKRIIVLEIAH